MYRDICQNFRSNNDTDSVKKARDYTLLDFSYTTKNLCPLQRNRAV